MCIWQPATRIVEWKTHFAQIFRSSIFSLRTMSFGKQPEKYHLSLNQGRTAVVNTTTHSLVGIQTLGAVANLIGVYKGHFYQPITVICYSVKTKAVTMD